MGFFTDAYDLFVISTVAALVTVQWHLSTTQTSWVTGSAILGGAASYGTLAFMGNIAPLTTLTAVFTEAVIAGMVGLIASAAVLALLENEEFRDVYRALHQLRTRVLPPQSEF